MTDRGSSVAKGASRTLMEDVDNGNDPLHQPLIAILKLLECLGLALEYSFDGVDRVALLHLSREGMIEKILSGLLLIVGQGLGQGGIKDGLEVVRRGDLSRSSRRHENCGQMINSDCRKVGVCMSRKRRVRNTRRRTGVVFCGRALDRAGRACMYQAP